MIEKGKYDEARQILTKLALWNGVIFPEIQFKLEETKSVEITTSDFLKIGIILSNFMITIYLFSTTSFNNYMMGYYLKYIGGNIFLNRTIKGIS